MLKLKGKKDGNEVERMRRVCHEKLESGDLEEPWERMKERAGLIIIMIVIINRGG